MKKILLFLLLTLPVLLLAQYPTTGNKQRLGWQTTGDGLVYRDAGYPSYTPNSRNNAYVYMDTVAKRYYHFANGVWRDLSDEKYIYSENASILATPVKDSLTTYDRLFIAMKITVAGGSDRGVQLPITSLDTSYAGRVVRVSAMDSTAGTYNVFVSSSSPDGLLVDGVLTTTYYLEAGETVEFQLYEFDGVYQWRLVHTNEIEEFPVAADSGYHVRSNSVGAPQWYQITQATSGDTIAVWNPNTRKLEFRTKSSLLSGLVSGGGTGVANQWAYWSDANTVATSIQLTRDANKIFVNAPINFEGYTTVGLPTLAQFDVVGNTTVNGLYSHNGTRGYYIPESTIPRGTNQRILYWDANGQVTDNNLLKFDGDFIYVNRLLITRSSNAYFNFTTEGLIFGTRLSGWSSPFNGVAFHWTSLTSGTEIFMSNAVPTSNGQSFNSPRYTQISKYFTSGSAKSEDFSFGVIRTAASQGSSYWSLQYGTHSTVTASTMSGRSSLTDYFRLYSNSGHLQLPMYLSTGNFEASDLGKTESSYAAWFATDGTIVQKELSSYSSWTLAGDAGTPQTIGSGETASILGGFGINTTASTTDIVTVEADTAQLATVWGLQNEDRNGIYSGSGTVPTNVRASITDSLRLIHARAGNLDSIKNYVHVGRDSVSIRVDGDIDDDDGGTGFKDVGTFLKLENNSFELGGWVFDDQGNTSGGFANPSIFMDMACIYCAEGNYPTLVITSDKQAVDDAQDFSAMFIEKDNIVLHASQLDLAGNYNTVLSFFASGVGIATQSTGDKISSNYINSKAGLSDARIDILADTAKSTIRFSDGVGELLENVSTNRLWRFYDKYNLPNATPIATSGVKSTFNFTGNATNTDPSFTVPTFFTQTADATVSNTTTETSLTSTGVGTKTIPVNYFQAGQTYVVRARGYFSTNGTTPNLTFDVEVGGVDVATTTAFAVQDMGGLNETWELVFEFTVRTTGSSGTAIGQGDFKYCPVHLNCRTVDLLNTSTFTINTTTTNAIDVTAEWGTASANNSITCTNLIVEVKN